MARITVLTNMKPTNVGNQALSTELLRLVARLRPDATVHAIGRSGGLGEIGARAVDDVPRLIERWVDELVQRASATPHPASADASYDGRVVPLVRRSKVRVAMRRWTRELRLRTRAKALLHEVGLRDEATQRQPLRTRRMGSSELVIYNAAGELNPHPGSFDVVLRSLVELLAAQRMGARTFVVNHSVECSDRFVEQVIAYVYPRLTGVVVRDQQSRDELSRLGVPETYVRVIPDIALLARPSVDAAVVRVRDPIPARRLVGISINYWDALEHEIGWIEFVRALGSAGIEVMFVSNALGQDIGFGKRLARKCGVRVQSYDYDYEDYSALLARLRLVVTNRLHTGVLAHVAGTPVVPVEANRFKVTALFREIEYPLRAISPGSDAWPTRLVEAVQATMAETADTSGAQLDVVRAKIEAGYAEVFGRS